MRIIQLTKLNLFHNDEFFVLIIKNIIGNIFFTLIKDIIQLIIAAD